MSNVLFGMLWGVGAVVAIWVGWMFLTGGGRALSLGSLVTGKDNRFSLSKLQATLWFFAIFFGYVATYAVRVRYGDVAALSALPENLMLLLALSAGGTLGSKWITGYKVRAGKITKTNADRPAAGNLVADDDGYSAWNKVQLFYFTALAFGIYGFGLVRELQLASAGSAPMLPEVDTALVVLMGLSQGAYLGKKAVTDDSQQSPSRLLT